MKDKEKTGSVLVFTLFLSFIRFKINIVKYGKEL